MSGSTHPHFEPIHPKGVWRNPGHVPALRAGATIYSTGITARDADGRVVAPGDAGAQARRIFEIVQAILAEAGADRSHLVKITTYLADRADAASVRQTRLEYLGPLRPPHTGLVVPDLGADGSGIRVEVEFIAVLPHAPRRRRQSRP
jgi:enamine deaminase RidA (YjgF/YER057c/UK114 family)